MILNVTRQSRCTRRMGAFCAVSWQTQIWPMLKKWSKFIILQYMHYSMSMETWLRLTKGALAGVSHSVCADMLLAQTISSYSTGNSPLDPIFRVFTNSESHFCISTQREKSADIDQENAGKQRVLNAILISQRLETLVSGLNSTRSLTHEEGSSIMNSSTSRKADEIRRREEMIKRQIEELRPYWARIEKVKSSRTWI